MDDEQTDFESDIGAAAAASRVSDGEYDADDDDDDANKEESLKTSENNEQRQYNAFICSKIDETWVSIAVDATQRAMRYT